MKSVKGQIDSLTNFVAPLYQTLALNTGDASEAKKQTVEALMHQVLQLTTTDNKSVDLYTITPVLRTIELILVSKIKSIPINKDTSKEAKELIEFYKETLISVRRFSELCSKTKKE